MTQLQFNLNLDLLKESVMDSRFIRSYQSIRCPSIKYIHGKRT